MLDSTPLVSVIIPFYNVELYLAECLDSILAQTYKHLEIILVNDGSTDKSVEIAKNYVAKDKRIQLITQENQGAGAARNTGLKSANGEWIYFIDSDDYIDKDIIESLVKESKKSLMILNTNVIFESKEMSFAPIYQKKKKGIVKINFNTIRLLEYYVWNCLFKKELIERHNIYFPINRSNAEDSDFLYRYICFIENFFCIYGGGGVYHHRLREDSIIGEIQKSKHFPLEPLDTFTSIFELYKKHNKLKTYGMPFKLLYEFDTASLNAEEFFKKGKDLVHSLGIEKEIWQRDRMMELFMNMEDVLEFEKKRGALREMLDKTFNKAFRIRLFKSYNVIKLFGIVLYESKLINK